MKTIIKTAGSFDKVLASCKNIGERYQPKSTALGITALSELLERSQQTSQAVTITRSAYRLAVNNRRESFAALPTLSVRVVRMLSTSESSRENLKDAIALKNMLQRRGRQKVTEENATTADTTVPARRAASRRHYDMQAQTFKNFIIYLEALGTYDANEPELTIDGLKAKLADMQSKSHAVNTAAIAFDNARREHAELFRGVNGVASTIQGVKNYVRAAFGTNSPEFEQLSKLK
jgi:hypothetical protein